MSSMPPPPPSGPGNLPPPPPGQPSSHGGPQDYDVVSAFSYAWKKFTSNLGPILGAVAVLLVGSAVVFFVLSLLFGGLGALAGAGVSATGSDAAGTAFGIGGSIAGLLFSLLLTVLVLLVQAAVVRAALALVDGRGFEFAALFSTHQLGAVVIGALIVGVLSAIGSALFVIPGLIVSFLTQFFLFFILDHGEDGWSGVVSSARFTIDNVVPVLLLLVLSFVAIVVGALLCGLGLLVAVPVVVIAQAYTFRVLTNGHVAA